MQGPAITREQLTKLSHYFMKVLLKFKKYRVPVLTPIRKRIFSDPYSTGAAIVKLLSKKSNAILAISMACRLSLRKGRPLVTFKKRIIINQRNANVFTLSYEKYVPSNQVTGLINLADYRMANQYSGWTGSFFCIQDLQYYFMAKFYKV